MAGKILVRGLTTTKAPFIEEAKKNGELFIRQPYELYSKENQKVWTKLYNNIMPLWEKHANEKFLEGIQHLSLSPRQIPKLEDINRFLEPLTGFQAKPVSGYVPPYLFFECLKNRQFPTTITIRDGKKLEYLPEPDIFHDIAGHVPMHTDPVFADILVKCGSLAGSVAKRHAHISSSEEQIAKVKSNLKALARFFWFTIEFGLMKEGSRLCVYGSGILSSAGEIQYATESRDAQRYPFRLEWVVNQSFQIDSFQPLFFVIDSFEHLYEEVKRLETFLNEGKLDNVAYDEPHIGDKEIEDFLYDL
jgi:phenylalanine-4-hydroxylase